MAELNLAGRTALVTGAHFDISPPYFAGWQAL